MGEKREAELKERKETNKRIGARMIQWGKKA